jgi:hypothetical protein
MRWRWTYLGSSDVGNLSFTTRLTLGSGVHDEDWHLGSHVGGDARAGRGGVKERRSLAGRDERNEE